MPTLIVALSGSVRVAIMVVGLIIRRLISRIIIIDIVVLDARRTVDWCDDSLRLVALVLLLHKHQVVGEAHADPLLMFADFLKDIICVT